MKKKMIALVAVLVFTTLYIIISNIPMMYMNVPDISKEGNGMIGRFVNVISESMLRPPAEFLPSFSLFLAFSIGLVFYWKRIHD